MTAHTHLNPDTCVCVGIFTPPARQAITTSNPSTCVCVGKSTPPARQTTTTSNLHVYRLAFVLENPQHQHAKPAPTATTDLRLCWKIRNTSTSNYHHRHPCWWCGFFNISAKAVVVWRAGGVDFPTQRHVSGLRCVCVVTYVPSYVYAAPLHSSSRRRRRRRRRRNTDCTALQASPLPVKYVLVTQN